MHTFLPFAWARKPFHSVQEYVGDDAGVGGRNIAGHLHHYRRGVDAVSDAQEQMSQPADQEHAGYSHHALGCPHLRARARAGLSWHLAGLRKVWWSSSYAVCVCFPVEGRAAGAVAWQPSSWTVRSRDVRTNLGWGCRLFEVFWGSWIRHGAVWSVIISASKIDSILNHLLGRVRLMTLYASLVLEQSDDNLDSGKCNPSSRDSISQG